MTKKNQPLNARLTRMQISRYERERRMQQLIVLGSVALGVVTVALIAAALVQIFVIEPQRVVASVGGQAIPQKSWMNWGEVLNDVITMKMNG